MATKRVRHLLRGQACNQRVQGHRGPCNPTHLAGRGCSAGRQDRSPKISAFRPAADSSSDWIGPPDRLSNIRPIIYHVPAEETALETRLRTLRQDTEVWNHEFWAYQNVTFSKEKEEYITAQLEARGLGPRDAQGRKHSLSSEEMAVFYKSFLDANRTRHANYNKEWYRRNVSITLLMGRVLLTNVWKRISSRSRKTSSSSS